MGTPNEVAWCKGSTCDREHDCRLHETCLYKSSAEEARQAAAPEKKLCAALPADSDQRKQVPLARGCFDYFPAALAKVAGLSWAGNEKHNPGQYLHWSRGKSGDHADCILRHLLDRGTIDDDGCRHSAKVAWRALAMLQEELERAGEAPLSRASRMATA